MRMDKIKAFSDLLMMTKRIADAKAIDEKKAQICRMQLEVALESGNVTKIIECRNSSVEQYIYGLDNSIAWYKEVQEFQKNAESDLQGAVDEATKDLQG